MDKEVTQIMGKYLKPAHVKALEDELREHNCIIYHSKLPKMTEQEIKFVDGTPDAGYPIRILKTYRDHCNCQWSSDGTGGEDALSPLLKHMNALNRRRAEILTKAIKLLEQV